MRNQAVSIPDMRSLSFFFGMKKSRIILAPRLGNQPKVLQAPQAALRQHILGRWIA
jgi:hypothetical protein